MERGVEVEEERQGGEGGGGGELSGLRLQFVQQNNGHCFCLKVNGLVDLDCFCLNAIAWWYIWTAFVLM